MAPRVEKGERRVVTLVLSLALLCGGEEKKELQIVNCKLQIGKIHRGDVGPNGPRSFLQFTICNLQFAIFNSVFSSLSKGTERRLHLARWFGLPSGRGGRGSALRGRRRALRR